jgi:eukaryotic-like serine/threonine-protein kinase
LSVEYSPEGQLTQSFDYGSGPVVWSPDGKYLAASTNSGLVCVWDVMTGETLAGYTGHANLVNALDWSPDGTRLASGGDDGTIQIWQVG